MAKQPETKTTKRKRGFFRRVLVLFVKLCLIFSLIIIGLSVYYRYRPPLASALMLWRLPGTSRMDYRWRPMTRISTNLAHAVIASEDGQFCSHNGVDWQAVSQVWEKFRKNPVSRPRGASTIPMQVARNLFLWPSRDYVRKALEVPIAYMLDALWTKRQMIEIYLNIVEWGPGIYGAEAASNYYFRRRASKLTRTQAALLAAALPNPLARNPARPSRKLKRISRSVEKRAKSIRAHAACISANYRE